MKLIQGVDALGDPVQVKVHSLDEAVSELNSAATDRSLRLLTGAAASIWPPSGLPTGQQVIDEIVGGLLTAPSDTVDPSLSELLEGKSPEVILQAISESIDDPSRLQQIYDPLEGDAPNFFHHLIARAASRHKLPFVLTANLDCLVESALHTIGRSYKIRYRPGDASPLTEFTILKLHGSVGGETQGERQARLRSLSVTLRDMAKAVGTADLGFYHGLLQDKTLLVLGYSGNDLDIMWRLYQVAGASSTRIIWCIRPGASVLEEQPVVSMLAQQFSDSVVLVEADLRVVGRELASAWQLWDDDLRGLYRACQGPPEPFYWPTGWGNSIPEPSRVLSKVWVLWSTSQPRAALEIASQDGNNEKLSPLKVGRLHLASAHAYRSLGRYRSALDCLRAAEPKLVSEGAVEEIAELWLLRGEILGTFEMVTPFHVVPLRWVHPGLANLYKAKREIRRLPSDHSGRTLRPGLLELVEGQIHYRVARFWSASLFMRPLAFLPRRTARGKLATAKKIFGRQGDLVGLAIAYTFEDEVARISGGDAYERDPLLSSAAISSLWTRQPGTLTIELTKRAHVEEARGKLDSAISILERAVELARDEYASTPLIRTRANLIRIFARLGCCDKLGAQRRLLGSEIRRNEGSTLWAVWERLHAALRAFQCRVTCLLRRARNRNGCKPGV